MTAMRLLDNTKTLTALNSDSTEGRGRLTEAVSAIVTEERNGAFTLEFQLPITAKHFAEIGNGSIVKAKPNPYDAEQMFRIFKVSKPLNGIVTFKANHITYDLNKTSVKPFNAVGASDAVTKIAANMTGGSDFTITTNISNTASAFKNSIPQSARALFGGQNGSLLDVFGGEWRWNNLICTLMANRGSDRGVRIAYGKNLTDIRQEENIESMYTAVMPFVKMTADDDAILGDLQTIIVSTEPRILNLDVSSSFSQGDTITKAAINAAAQRHINANDLTNPKVSLSVSFVNLAATSEYRNIAILEQIHLCDTVTVEFEKLGVNTKAKVIKTVFNVLADRYESIEIGSVRSTLAQTIGQLVSDITYESKAMSEKIDDAIAHATDLITGGLGGYVIIGRNANGEPEEILIMDTPDKLTATNVIRFNRNGIGFSTTGYSGPYTNAWTIDGQLVADFITTGTLDANIIRAGEIADLNGLNFWNLETGEFKLSSAVEIDNGGDTLSSILNDIENDIDGKIETWYQASDPAGSWTTADMKAAHVGDIWYNTTDNTTQRYRLNGSTYEWQEMTVSDDVFDEIDGKATVFISEPVPPYSVGDLWFDSASSDIKTCITARATGSYTATDWQKRNKYTDDSALDSFLTNTYAPDKQTLEGSIDGKAETWYQLADPALNWTAQEKTKHTGDLWYRTSDSTTWRYTGSAWQEQEAPDDVFDAIDGKCQVFTAQPTPPYNVGDLWFNSSTSDIKTCITPRTSSETYTAADWEKRNKYTDDSAVTTLDNSLDQSGVFNRLTNNGALQGIYMDGGQLYINATYIKSGTLVLGGNNNASGTLRINNASGTQIGKWDKDGINIQGGTFRETNGSAWLEMSSAELKGGYTGYSGQAECDLATTLNYSGNRKGAAALYHSNGYAWMEASRCFIIGSLHIGDSWGGGTWTGYTGTINGVGYFKNGILTT